MPKKPSKPRKMLAYSVLCETENTGGIVFAKTSIVALRLGAARFHGGDIDGLSCRRAAYADKHADQGDIPASTMVGFGWTYECSGCGVKITGDLRDDWRDSASTDETFAQLRQAARRYRNWTPDDVIGNQDTAVFCDAKCKADDDAYHAERRRREARAIEAFKRRILRRFPDAEIPDTSNKPVPDGKPAWQREHHAYATKIKGRWRVKQITVAFGFPGMAIGYASLHYNPQSHSARKDRQPQVNCCYGDKEAFETWAAGHAA